MYLMNTKISLITMKVYQDKAREIETRTGALSIFECMTAWGYHSSSATRYAMDRMVEVGLLEKFPRGKYTTYRVARGEQ